MKYCIITNCSSRKRALGSSITSCQITQRDSLLEFVKAWVARLGDSKAQAHLGDLYQGRAFGESRLTAGLLNANLYVVSAGLGLVGDREPIPHYSLTISTGEGSIRQWLEAKKARPSDWWSALNEELQSPNPLSTLVNEASSDTLVLLALPASYLAMVSQDLSRISTTFTSRIRIFTSEAGIRLLPTHLKEMAMPYDDRLEGLATHSGTRTEFPHRSLRHFVEKLQGHRLELPQAKAAVITALTGFQGRVIPKRKKATDAQICQLIRSNWTAYGGSSTRLLRYLRDDAIVACEQSRFRSMWLLIQAEKQPTGLN